MRRGRAFAIVRLVVLVCCIAVSLLATPKPAAAQGQDIFDDECFDLGLGTGCDVEGFSAILSTTTSSEIDTYVSTSIDNPDLMDQGYLAQVDGALFEGSNNFPVDETEAFDDGSGVAQSIMSDPVDLNTFYLLEGDHSLVNNNNCDIDPNCGQSNEVGTTGVAVSTAEPTVTSISPTFGYVGTSGIITVTGTALIDPFTGTANVSLTPGTGMGGISGVSVSVDGVTPDGTTAILSYTIDQNATTGNILINIITTFGSDNGDKTFTIGDPPPIITSVSPAVWQAGTASLPITISGSGFGTSPTVTVAGSGVSLVSVGSMSDTLISATVSIASNAPNGPATVTVQSNGYDGSGFQPAQSGESPISSYTVQVQAAPGPAPKIFLYGTTDITGQTTSVIAGQQIALSATVSLPQGVSISSQQWSMPEGTVIGGYNASTSGGCVVLIAGQSSQTGACTGNPVSTTTSSFAFYWVDARNSRQITYTYTASNGSTNSATTTFNVAGPTGANLSPQTSTVNILPPGYNPKFGGLPGSQFGFYPNSPYGINFTASATLPGGNQGAYSFVQLISSDTIKRVAAPAKNSQTCTPSGFNTDPNPELDNTYPYGSASSNTTNDSPGQALLSSWGELARSFSPTMYILWTPTSDSRCTSGSTCTIPVPLGSVSWHYFADAINTLAPQQNSTTWTLNSGSGSANQFQSSSLSSFPFGYPTWSKTYSNSSIDDPNYWTCK
jgi:hypothetical protein